ncbi:hypothetical protein Tco_1282269 [Tanacetum coccineum]
MNIIMKSTVDNASVNVHKCEKCLKLETGLLNKKDFIEKETYDKLFRSFTTLEKHCISLELSPKRNTVIKKLKERIKSLIGNINEDNVKKDKEEIETINIELDHKVSKLIAENEHLKQTYKQLYVSIKPTCIRSKEQCDALVSQVNQKFVEIYDLNVMAILVISVSSDSLEYSVGTPAGRVILFGTIPTTIPDTTPVITPPTTQTNTIVIPTEIPIIAPTIPPSPDYTPVSPDYSPASDTEFDPSKDPSLDHIPPLPAISLFLSSVDDTTDSDTPDTPLSPTHEPIPHGRPYSYHLNGPVHMMTMRKKVGLLPTHCLDVRHLVNYSYSGHFSTDDSSLSSSSETSLDSPADALSDYASSRSSFDHSLPASPLGMRSSHRLRSLVLSVHRSFAIFERPSHDSSSASRSCKRSRSPVASVPLSLPTLEALSYARADRLPSPKRIRSPGTATDLEGCLENIFEPYVPKEVGLGVDFEDESSEPSKFRGADLEIDVDVVRREGIKIDPEIQAEIDEYFAYADALRDKGIDARVVVEAADREESKTGTRGPVERFHDHTEAIPVYRIQVIEGAQREQGCRNVGAESAVTILIEIVAELERDNMRLRSTASVESQRVD